MDVSNLTTVSQQVAPVAKAGGGDTGTQKSASRGNSLPVVERSPLDVDKPKQEESSAEKPSAEELGELVTKLNESSTVRSKDLKFSVADGTDLTVVRVEDSETGELIRQIPSEQMVELARALEDQRRGTMLEEKV